MSMLTDAMESCTIINKSIVDDGYGGYDTQWKEGAAFKAAIVFDTSMQARVAAVQGVTNLYTVYTSRAITLEYHDVFRRESDEKIFRVTSDGDDKKTPAGAGLDLRVVTAEEWALTKELTG